MAKTETKPESPTQAPDQLERGTYEIIRNRLKAHAGELRARLEKLNAARRDVFGSIETRLLNTERVTTENNCVPRDIVALGDKLLFGYNVHIGLRKETVPSDVFAVYRFADNQFHPEPLTLLDDERFQHDFAQLYKYYRSTTFARFSRQAAHLFMVFRVGKDVGDVKTFKWLIEGDQVRYLDNRSDHEFRYPPQHEFEWQRTTREMHRSGLHPHISIEDRIFVETVGGDLTIKVEDNTADGGGIYAEDVDNKDQVLDDADIYYASLGNIILLKIRPYQEKAYRYIAYNEKMQQAVRIDAMASSCVLLPEGHGLIFSNGYYLQTGEYKKFESNVADLLFERRIPAANGEDFLYAFYNRESGTYVLLLYNMIEQQVATPLICNGYCTFEDGRAVLFRCDEQPQKHHTLQVWQTPYVGANYVPDAETTSYLYKIGNRDIVRGMAECHEILSLIDKEDTYAGLYIDLAKKAGDVVDSYFWVNNAETFNLGEVLLPVKEAANSAIDEFEKVVRVRRNTKQQFDRVSADTHKLIGTIRSRRFESIDDFVASLSQLRRVRGEIIGLKDLKYVDLPAVDALEKEVAEHSDKLAQRAVEFLLRKDALAPYEKRVDEQRKRIEVVAKVAEAQKLAQEIDAGASELEMLIDVVGNLKIDDATQRTAIIDNISAIYSHLNQARAALKKRRQELLKSEGAAEFGSQMKLVGQAMVNYLDVCDSPEKCDEYLTKVMIQIEELEGRFAEFDDFVVQLAEKREEVYAAFDARKLALVEARNKRASALMSAADRILKGIATRVGSLPSISEIHSYFASDLMIEKVRDIVRQLTELEDSVKVDDIQSRLKTIREDAVRQLKDKQELFVGGQNIIKLGKHQFTVNTQPLDLTTVLKGGEQYFHLTGTNFFERITDERLLATRDVWEQSLVSENREVYRAEYLAKKLLESIEQDETATVEEILALSQDDLVAFVQNFMGPRYAEGYTKGVHDHDAALIFRALLDMATSIGLLRYGTRSRALASVFWTSLPEGEQKQRLHAKLQGVGEIARLFSEANGRVSYVSELKRLLGDFARETALFPESLVPEAADYLFDEISGSGSFCISQPAAGIARDFRQHLKRRKAETRFNESVEKLRGGSDRGGADRGGADAAYLLTRNWVEAFIAERGNPAGQVEYADEAAAALLDGSLDTRRELEGSSVREIAGLVGEHPRAREGTYQLNLNEFLARLNRYEAEVVPRFVQFTELKKQLADQQREELRLDEFKPRVLTSFVRNRLLDEVYLPMIGDNLAKQVGVAGEQKRTDLMGLLLLVSPPGYGKTTLMEYIANRLGITFVKINGPAIGHAVTSLDPLEAPNASAREEVEKLNLSLEMGDNVMIYLDDIQHTNPEFLQKFISLCDAQRKIEGVYKGRTRTYDLRGRKVCVVMAGNPYTESGEKFQIPDMLSNRADTYNLGDVVGDNSGAFEMSYLENCLTSNTTLGQLAARSRKDVYAVIKMASTEAKEPVDLEGNYSVEELNEMVSVMRKLIRIRDVVLRVNEEYIRSAAQANEYRTEPAFKLQGSYRDMNKLAERVVPIMNDQELETLILAHYENQAQTLTTGAESNLLKLKEMLKKQTPQETQRWEEIKRTFKRNLLLGGASADDKFGQVLAQMSVFSEGLYGIKQSLDAGMSHLLKPEANGDDEHLARVQIAQAVAHLAAFNQNLASIKASLDSGSEALGKFMTAPPAAHAVEAPREVQEHKVQVVNKVPKAFLDVIKTQFDLMQGWMRPLLQLTETHTAETRALKSAVEQVNERYQQLISRLEGGE
jgi:hypothetical protein